MNDACKHNIDLRKACPWCERKLQTDFQVTSPFLAYQHLLGIFVQKLAGSKELYGPHGHLIIFCDLSGEMAIDLQGTPEALRQIRACLKQLDERLSNDVGT